MCFTTGKGETWVTFVGDQKSVSDALILAKSIRRISTRRQIVVLHNPKLPLACRKNLMSEFDKLVELQLEFDGIKTDLATLARIYCWSLSCYKKCVFLDAKCLVIDNCDELFDYDAVCSVDKSGKMDMSVLVISPSLNEYCTILKTIKMESDKNTETEVDIKDIMGNYISNQSALTVLDHKFFHVFDNTQNKQDLESITENPVIVKLSEEWPSTINKAIFETLKLRTVFLQEIVDGTVSKVSTPEDDGQHTIKEPIAIVGMSCRLPGADNLDEFWNMIINNEHAIRELPEDRWLPEQSCNVTAQGRKIKAGWLKSPIDLFDETFFGITPFELEFTDPQQRLLLQQSWEALEDACIDVTSIETRKLGIFTGQWTQNYHDLRIEAGYWNTDFFRSYMGNAFGTTSGRLAHFFKANGPTISSESGCSSSMVAVGLACESLRNRTSNVALAGGVNLLLKPYSYEDLKSLISEDGQCKTFDASADGFGRAEGCAVLVLKRLSDAVKDNDRIHAVIRGYGSAQEGNSASLGTPTVECEALAMQLALDDADVSPLEVSYIEAHGTGTAVGDPLEIKAITKAYSSEERQSPLVIGSVKTNVGHTESCSGITGIIKTVLALQKCVIPPHCGFKTLNPQINLDNIPAIIPVNPQPWISSSRNPRIAGVSSFGITGTDAHVILQEAPTPTKLPTLKISNENYPQIVTLSAKSQVALDCLAEKYKTHLEKTNPNINDVAYTTNIGRTHFNYRMAIIGNECSEIVTSITNHTFKSGQITGEKPKLCFLFTGQGSQYYGMGKILYGRLPVFKDNFDLCDNYLKSTFSISIKDALWGEDQTLINQSLYSQTSIFVIQYCLTKLWESWGIKPETVLGHSLGEFAAATAAGILKVEDALKLVGTRSKLINALPSGKMMVIKSNESSVKHLLTNFINNNNQRWLDFAAINSNEQITLAGKKEAIIEFANFCKINETKTHIIDATHAFHSRDMDPILKAYRQIVNTVQLSKPKCQFISGVEGCELTEIDSEYWIRHTREPVKFLSASKSVYDFGVKNFLEIGPHPVLSALIKRNIQEIKPDEQIQCSFSMRKNSDESLTLTNAIADLYVNGINLNWNKIHLNSQNQKILLPFYAFQNKSRWFNPEGKLEYILQPRSFKFIHPLLGGPLLSPTEQVVFQKMINQTNIPYIVDHKIGDHIIFPGSCYLEMSLAAGYAAFFNIQEDIEEPEVALAIENITIKSAFEILHDDTYEVQTVVSTINSDEDWSKVVTYSRKRGLFKSDVKKWTPHSEAKFSCFGISKSLQHCQTLKEVKEKVNQVVETDIYTQLSEFGYKFGPKFQTLKAIWKNDTEFLTMVEMPANMDSDGYLCHPTIIDAMIQTSLVANSTTIDSLQLPIFVKKFVWLKCSSTTVNYIYLDTNNDEKRAMLYDENGDILAYMVGVELIKTTLLNFCKTLESHKETVLPMFVEQWRACPKDDATEAEATNDEAVGVTSTRKISRCSIDGKQKLWIVFSNESSLCVSILKKLKGAKKSVVTIKAAENFTRKNQLEFEICPNTQSAYYKIFQNIHSSFHGHEVEGILYLWSCDSTQTENLTKSYLYLLQSIIDANLKVSPKIFLVTQGQVYIGEQNPEKPSFAPILGLNRSFKSEFSNFPNKAIDLDPNNCDSTENANELFSELFKDDAEPFIAFRRGLRHIARLTSWNGNMQYGPLSLPNSTRFSLILPSSKSIADLKFGHLSKPILQDNEVEIQIKAAGLNFRDIFTILKPTKEFESLNSVGSDFSGVISRIGPNVKSRKVGDAVLGCNLRATALPSHTILSEDQLVSLPKSWTFAEGATLPCVFATAYQCLVTSGKLQKGETILIHTASGGVGLCAIQIAQQFGAIIIATAGSERKRAYLRSLGIGHVFSSRDLAFEDGVKKATNSKGVNMVLNSLTGPGFKEASLNCCNKNARFLEMSKLNIWTVDEVEKLRPDVRYTVEDLSTPDVKLWEYLMKQLGKSIEDGTIKPLPTNPFDALHIRDAFKYLEKAKQIGKVTCVMPEISKTNGTVDVSTPLFNDRSSYLITGGLTGIGLEIAKWLCKSGAKFIILCGRRKPSSSAEEILNELSAQGNTITVMQVDISNFIECKALFDSISTTLQFPPLRGIFHSAGCLSDATISNQTWEKFEITMNPKVRGGWNLHVLSKDLNLEHFVLFSSIVAVLGCPGQSNHSASNTFLDALAQYRNSMGLVATSVNWGQWGETGIAAGKQISGFTPFATAHALSSLERVLKSKCTQAAVCDGDVHMWKSFFPWAKSYLNEIKTNVVQENERKVTISSEDFWKELKQTVDFEQRYEVVYRNISKILCSLLKFNGNEAFGKNQPFQELGMDSLMMIEFKNHIQNLLGSTVVLSSNDMTDCNTLDLLTTKLIQVIFDNIPEDKDSAMITLNNLIKEDSKLWPHIQGDGVTVEPSKVKTVLLTGVTGFLGPYMLRELSMRSNIQTIYCLMRESKSQTLRQRLEARLLELDILHEVDLTKVHTVAGDISKVALGMSESVFSQLSTEVEAVIHCAVYANHLEEYRKQSSQSGKYSTLRDVNVIGTQRILEFAAMKRTKLVYNASTLFALGSSIITETGPSVPEHWPKADEFDNLPNFGYAITKFCSDRLLAQANDERKIPCKCFRFGKIGGDSRDGRQHVKTNHFFMKFLCYIKSEMIPDIDVPLQIVPVDVCAKLTLEVFFKDSAQFTMYNVFNPHTQNEKEIAVLGAEFGFSVKLVKYEDFVQKLEDDGHNSLLYLWKSFYTNHGNIFTVYDSTKKNIPLANAWKNTDGFFAKSKLADTIPEMMEIVEKPLDILRKEIQYAVKTYDIFNQ